MSDERETLTWADFGTSVRDLAQMVADDFEPEMVLSIARGGLLIGGALVILSNHCDAVQAALLMELGRWSEAEEVLTRAMAEFEAAMRAPSWHPAIVLADLRIRRRLGRPLV